MCKDTAQILRFGSKGLAKPKRAAECLADFAEKLCLSLHMSGSQCESLTALAGHQRETHLLRMRKALAYIQTCHAMKHSTHCII